MSIDGALNGVFRLAIAAAVIGAGALAFDAVLAHLKLDGQVAERRALLQRSAELNIGALAPGSALACLDGTAGETIENACEKAVFASPQSAAGAVAYTAARLDLLKQATEVAQRGDPGLAETFAVTRRAIELDRYGIAAHVLALRDGCTAERCAAFALLHDTVTLKANLKAQAFDTYVARYVDAWSKSEVVAEKPSAAPAQAPVPVASAPAGEPPGAPLASKYDFPSAASIPPVSIMNTEPALPKPAADAQAVAPVGEGAAVPVPPKRPQAQAATPPAR